MTTTKKQKPKVCAAVNGGNHCTRLADHPGDHWNRRFTWPPVDQFTKDAAWAKRKVRRKPPLTGEDVARASEAISAAAKFSMPSKSDLNRAPQAGTPESKIWIAKNGDERPITVMTAEHIENTIAMLQRKGTRGLPWVGVLQEELRRRGDTAMRKAKAFDAVLDAAALCGAKHPLSVGTTLCVKSHGHSSHHTSKQGWVWWTPGTHPAWEGTVVCDRCGARRPASDGNCTCTLPLVPATPQAFVKHDAAKVRLELIPAEATFALGRAFTYGVTTKGYPVDNWAKCDDPRRYVGATLRHLTSYQAGDFIDAESGLAHLDHAIASLAMLIGLVERAAKRVDTNLHGAPSADIKIGSWVAVPMPMPTTAVAAKKEKP